MDSDFAPGASFSSQPQKDRSELQISSMSILLSFCLNLKVFPVFLLLLSSPTPQGYVWDLSRDFPRPDSEPGMTLWRRQLEWAAAPHISTGPLGRTGQSWDAQHQVLSSYFREPWSSLTSNPHHLILETHFSSAYYELQKSESVQLRSHLIPRGSSFTLNPSTIVGSLKLGGNPGTYVQSISSKRTDF